MVDYRRPTGKSGDTSMRPRTNVLIGMLGSCTLLFAGAVKSGVELIRCSSVNRDRQVCRVQDMSAKQVQLYRQLSNTRCAQGQTWGSNQYGIWVDRGCRADFQVSAKNATASSDEDPAEALGGDIAAIIAASLGYRGNGFPETPHHTDQELPNYVLHRCQQRASELVRERHAGRYAAIDRITDYRRRARGWRLKAYYLERYEHEEHTRYALCEVNDHRVTKFRYD